MKKLIKLLLIFTCITFCNLSLANGLNNNVDINSDNDDESIISKYIDDYIKDNENRDDNSTKLFEKQYEFEFYPYLSIEYTSKEIDDFSKIEK